MVEKKRLGNRETGKSELKTEEGVWEHPSRCFKPSEGEGESEH